MKANLLDEMLSDMSCQSALHRPSQFWEKALLEIGTELCGENIKNFRQLPGAKRCFVPTYQLDSLAFYGQEFVELIANLPGNEKLETQKGRALFEWLRNGAYLANSDYRTYMAGDNCSESKVGCPDEHWNFEGRNFSRSMLNYLNGLVFLKQNVDTSDLSKVLEVGGGFGTLGEILLKDTDRDYAYVDVDIPPSAFAASYYLNSIYPEGSFFDYQFAKRAAEIEMDKFSGSALVVCPWQLEKIRGPIDLFVNFISFQEMEPEIVEHYLDHVQRLESKYALIRNLREGKPKRSETCPWGVDRPILGSDYDRMFRARGFELVATNVYPFGFKTVDGFHSELRLYKAED